MSSMMQSNPAPALTLRPYQQEALAALRDAHDRGVRRQFLVMPAGAGMTVVFAELIRQLLAHVDSNGCTHGR